MNNFSLLPDGTQFPFWDDETKYSRAYHVAMQNPNASDENDGSEERPFLTINRAAQQLQPGEKVIVHEGIYRETVRPLRGGTSASQMIAYEAAPGKTVAIFASEKYEGRFVPSKDWETGGADAWQFDIPAAWFVGGYNPFMIRNFTMEYSSFVDNWSTEENHRFLLRRGMIYVDGRPLKQVLRAEQLGAIEGSFWVEDPGLRLHIRLWDDANPNDLDTVFEITTREQCFMPQTEDINFLRLSGFQMRYAADGPPIPQRSMVSANCGHHWIIEDNDLQWANACALDIGYGSWHKRLFREAYTGPAAAGHSPTLPESGHHIVRRNLIAHCGIGGIAGVGNSLYSLFEDNILEHIGGINLERLWETAALKLHTCYGVLIRGNIFRHIKDSTVVWLDYLINNTRLTNNVVYDVASLHGGLMVEVSDEINWIDHNYIWDVRGVEDIWHSTSGVSGPAVNIDSAENCLIAHNFIANIPDEYAIAAHMAQDGRVVMGRVMMGSGHRVLNNVLVNCPKRILFSVPENESDGNIFADTDDYTSLLIEKTVPPALVNLRAWQRHFNFDTQGQQLPLSVAIDNETLQITLEVGGELPTPVSIPELHGERPCQTAGPWDLKSGTNIHTIKESS